MHILKPDAPGIEKASALLGRGALVAVPTETVYGLAADAHDAEAIAKIYAVKGRPSYNPLIAHVCSIAMAEAYCLIDALSRRLMETFWPGPLTLVLPLRRHDAIPAAATAGLPTIAVRHPQGVFSQIIMRLGRAVVAPSANRSGQLSPTTPEAVLASLGDKIAYVVDGGACPIGVESTIIKTTQDGVFLLRPGGIARESLEQVLGAPLLTCDPGSAIEAPGMLRAHYAPKAQLRLNAFFVRKGEGLLAFGRQETLGSADAQKVLNLSLQGDLLEAAHNLFDFLKKFDDCGISVVAVQPISSHGLGEAINDRLRRAAVREHADG